MRTPFIQTFLLLQSDFYKINGTFYAPAYTITTPTMLRNQVKDNPLNVSVLTY